MHDICQRADNIKMSNSVPWHLGMYVAISDILLKETIVILFLFQFGRSIFQFYFNYSSLKRFSSLKTFQFLK